MKIILLENVTRLGKCGDTVEVKDGFARNYLIPKGAALQATDANMKVYNERRGELERLDLKKKAEAQELSEKLGKLSITIAQEAKEDEELYGSVSSAVISEGLEKEGFDIKKENILIADPIKKLGVYQVKVRLHPEVESEIKVWVVKK